MVQIYGIVMFEIVKKIFYKVIHFFLSYLNVFHQR